MRSWTAPLLALAVALVLVAPTVRADDDWGDGGRHVDTEVRSDGFNMTSDRLQGAERDRIRLSLDARSLALAFELLGNATAAEPEAGLRIEVRRVLEFRDAGGNGTYVPSDPVVAEYQPEDFSVAAITAANVTSNGVPGVQVTANYTFRDEPTATFGIRATAFGNLTTFENMGLQPVETKLDLLFSRFPYREPDTLPAVELRVGSEFPGAPATGTAGLHFRTGVTNVTFTWKTVAIVDGAERPVRVTTTPGEPGNESEVGVVFAYARGSSIVHDPTVGFAVSPAVQVLTSVLGNPLFYAAGALAALAVFGLSAGVRRGRKPKDR